jgi:hypothetical protein
MAVWLATSPAARPPMPSAANSVHAVREPFRHRASGQIRGERHKRTVEAGKEMVSLLGLTFPRWDNPPGRLARARTARRARCQVEQRQAHRGAVTRISSRTLPWSHQVYPLTSAQCLVPTLDAALATDSGVTRAMRESPSPPR